MNVAALVSGPVVDGFNIGLRKGVDIGSIHWTGNRLVIFTCTVSNILSWYIAWRYLREIKVTDDLEEAAREGSEETAGGGENAETMASEGSTASLSMLSASAPIESPFHSDDIPSYTEDEGEEEEEVGDEEKEVEEFSGMNSSASCSAVQTGEEGIETYTPKPQDPWTTVKELAHSPTFWRFAALTLLLVNLHAIFRHLDATLPTYLVRCFGPSVPKGTLYSINPFMIIFLTPTVAGLTNTYNHFDMIKWGGYLTAASPFFPAMSTSIWAVVCMNIMLSLGE
jgi:hypothetical protein